MVCNLDLFFQYRHALGKVIVSADFAGQLFNFGIGHGLRGGHALFGTTRCCQSCNNHANNLSQLFSRKSDQGVLDFIHSVRMEKAGQLLREAPNRTIQEIAFLTGYTSILTFNRKFKSLYGQTPTEYRKRFAGQK